MEKARKAFRTTERVRELARAQGAQIILWGHDWQGDFCIMVKKSDESFRSYKIKRIAGEVVLVPI